MSIYRKWLQDFQEDIIITTSIYSLWVLLQQITGYIFVPAGELAVIFSSIIMTTYIITFLKYYFSKQELS